MATGIYPRRMWSEKKKAAYLVEHPSEYVCKRHGPVEPHTWTKANGKTLRRCKICAAESGRRSRSDPATKEKRRIERDLHRDQRRASSRALRKRQKAAVIAGYGGHCACCLEDRQEFLSVDHIGGGGAAERRAGHRGPQFYAGLIRDGFPARFRLLCMNCNFSFGMFGYCPHQKEAHNADGSGQV